MKKGSSADGLVFHAGFPNAGEDQAEQRLSLDAVVFRHRLSTYLWQLEEDMPELGWRAGSTVVVNRALTRLSRGRLSFANFTKAVSMMPPGRSTDRKIYRYGV